MENEVNSVTNLLNWQTQEQKKEFAKNVEYFKRSIMVYRPKLHYTTTKAGKPQ